MIETSDLERLKEIFVLRRECDDAQDRTRREISAIEITMAEIKVQLNLVMGILGAVGVAVLSLVVKQFWG